MVVYYGRTDGVYERTGTQVLVVGAGPVGLTAAIELSRHGVPVRVIDRAPRRPDSESRALGTNSRSMELFERMGAHRPMLEEGLALGGFSFSARGRRLGRIALGGLDAPFPTMTMLGQGATERVLIGRLRELGVEVERPVELVGLRQDGAAVHATLRHDDGREEEVGGPYLVGADGAHSAVRKAVGASFGGVKMQGQYLVDAPVAWGEGGEPPADEGYFSLTPESMLLFGRMPNGLWRVIFSMQQDDPRMRRETPTRELMQSLVDEDHPWVGARLGELAWASAFYISNRMVEKMRFGRVFLAGDAAHIHSPAGGQGMNTGVQDAANLAWKLALNLRGFGGEALLDSYEAERYPIVESLLRSTEASEHALMARNPLVARLRDGALSVATRLGPAQAYGRRWLAGLTNHYRESPIVAEDGGLDFRIGGGPRAGDRAPDAVSLLTADGRTARLFEVLAADNRHHLLVFAGAPASPGRVEELGRVAELIEARHPALVRAHLVTGRPDAGGAGTLADVTGELRRRYGARSERLYLIRPDGYVGFRSRPSEPRLLEGYLDRTLGSGRTAQRRGPLRQESPAAV